MLKAAGDFARAYIASIPDFLCTRTVQHFLAKGASAEWKPEVKVNYELRYYGGDEHEQIIAVNDQPKTKVSVWARADGWVETHGNFSWIMSQVFAPKSAAEFGWQGWDNVGGKPAMVFSYRVERENSAAATVKCTDYLVHSGCKSYTYAFHGRIYLDRDSSDILRITQVPENVPAGYFGGPMQVDYGWVTVADKRYLLPRSDSAESTSGSKKFRNVATYSDYRKFAAESVLKN